MPFKTIEGHRRLFDRKKDFDFGDMFADPRIAEMVDGLLDFSEEQKEQLFELYDLIRLRKQLESQETRLSGTKQVSDKRAA